VQVRQACQPVWGTLTGWQRLPATDLCYRRELGPTVWAVGLLRAATLGALPDDLLALDAFGEDIAEQTPHPHHPNEPHLAEQVRRLLDDVGDDPATIWRTLRTTTMNPAFTPTGVNTAFTPEGAAASTPDGLLAKLAALPDQRVRLDRHEHHLICQLRDAGMPWTRIGAALGLHSIQAVRQRWLRLEQALANTDTRSPTRLPPSPG
jgi:hypothetical protein